MGGQTNWWGALAPGPKGGYGPVTLMIIDLHQWASVFCYKHEFLPDRMQEEFVNGCLNDESLFKLLACSDKSGAV